MVVNRKIPISVAAGVLLAAAAVLVLLAIPGYQRPHLPLVGLPDAAAQCGGVEKKKPKKKVNPRGHPPLAIGDSSMLLALPDLAREGYKVNARGCRQYTEGLALLRKLKRRHKLPHLTVIALGADASIRQGQVEKTLRILGRKRVLGLVTPRETGGGSGNDAEVCRRAGRRHPRRVRVLDWVNYSAGHSGWFQPDGLHLTFPGAHAFAVLLRKALPLARAGKFPQ